MGMVYSPYIDNLTRRFRLSRRSLRHELEEAQNQLLQRGGGNKELARTRYHVLAPSLGLMGDHLYFVLPVGTRLESRFVQVPYPITSGRSWLKLDDGLRTSSTDPRNNEVRMTPAA